MDDTEVKNEVEAEGEATAGANETKGEAEDTLLQVGFTKAFEAYIERIGGIEVFGAMLEAEAVRRGYTEGIGAGGGARRAAVDTSRLSPYEKILFGLGKT